MEGVIYVMSNNCFMIKDHYKIGFTTDIEQRKNSYTTAYPVACNWDYISDKISNIKTRERKMRKVNFITLFSPTCSDEFFFLGS